MTKIDVGFIIAVTVLFLFVFVCQTITYKDYRTKITLMNIEEQQKIKHQLTYQIDSLYHINKTSLSYANMEKRDSIWRELTISMQADYDSRLNNVVADLRQAYNDQTTILNNYITWWIAGYSVLITLISIVLGYVNTKRAQEDLLEYKQQVASTSQKEFDRVTQKVEEDKRKLEKAQKNIEENLDILHTEHLKSNLIIMVQSITTLAQLGNITFYSTDVQSKISELFRVASEYNKLLSQSINPINKVQQMNSLLIYINVLYVMVDSLSFVYTKKEDLNQLDKLRNCINRLMTMDIKEENDIEEVKILFNHISCFMTILCMPH